MSGTALALLTACGAPPTNPDTDPVPIAYETLDSTADATSVLGATMIVHNVVTKAKVLMNASGELVHNTGHTTIDVNDGYYVLVDPDGIDPDTAIIQDGSFIDGTGAEIQADTTFSDGYEYAYAFQLRHRILGVVHTARAVGGIVTHADHIPTAGSATYTGKAKGTIYNGTVFQQFGSNATSTVDVDFEAGSVDVEMTNFEAAPDLVDTITITDMSLTGNTFSGGTVGATNGGVLVEITGANTTTYAGGNLFGYDAALSGPDEVGGVFETDGDDGWMVGYFLAD